MNKYIEREALISELKALPEQERLECMGIYDCIRSMPVADVAKVNHGEWEMLDAGPDFAETECSECGAKHWFTPEHDFYDFCPHCGAKMERSNKDDSN